MSDDLLDFDEEDAPPEVQTTAQYRQLLLAQSPQILQKALATDPEDSNSTICTLLRELGKLNPADDPIILPKALADSLDGEKLVGEQMKQLVYAFLRGEMPRAAVETSLRQMSMLFEVLELTDLMKQLDKLKNGRGLI